jgi:hypothetical protein
MDHFPPSDWVDLAHGLLEDSKAAPLRAHLDQDCTDCLNSLATWQLISDLFSREASYTPPDAVVKAVKAGFVPEKRLRWLAEIAQFAQLVFDSFKQPSTATVRNAMQTARHLVHEASPFTIDLRLETDPLHSRMYLVGQILNSQNPEKTTNGIDVVLLSGEHLVNRTVAKVTGEFDLDFAPEPNLQLFINIRGQRAIGIVLPDLDS